MFVDVPCQTSVVPFFDVIGRHGYREAKAVCEGCPVAAKTACLEEALTAERGACGQRRYGVFGGLTPTERYRYARQRQLS